MFPLAESLRPLVALRRAWAANIPLTFIGVSMLITLVFTLAGLVLDPRVITGAPAWLKPTKFAISVAIFSFTLLWLLTFVQGHTRLVRLVSWGITLGFVIEVVVIVGQVIRGTTSHFNISTPLDGALFSVMAVMIVVVWAMTLLAAALLLRQRLPNSAFAWALRLSLVLVLIGSAEGFFMTSLPSPSQRAAIASGQRPTAFGAHSVGVDDGGSGLPIVGWSTVGGDLRPAHFAGLHAMQILPFLGWWIVRRARRQSARHQTALVCTAGLAYLGLIGVLTSQALRGQPIITPDTQTLAALVALVVSSALAALAITLHGRAQITRPLALQPTSR